MNVSIRITDDASNSTTLSIGGVDSVFGTAITSSVLGNCYVRVDTGLGNEALSISPLGASIVAVKSVIIGVSSVSLLGDSSAVTNIPPGIFAFASSGFTTSSCSTAEAAYKLIERLKFSSKTTHQMQLHPIVSSYFIARDRIFRILNSEVTDGLPLQSFSGAVALAHATVDEDLQLRNSLTTRTTFNSPALRDDISIDEVIHCEIPVVVIEELELFDEVIYLYEVYAIIQEHFGAMSSSIGTP